MHTLDEMSPALKLVVEKLSVGNLSTPAVIQLADETKAYRILRLNKKIDSHLANLVDDFSMIKDFAIKIKQQDELFNWIEKTLDKTYIKINDSISECEFKNKWIK
jgi:peptidyl-prolyl cis-trans isomerase SurA